MSSSGSRPPKRGRTRRGKEHALRRGLVGAAEERLRAVRLPGPQEGLRVPELSRQVRVDRAVRSGKGAVRPAGRGCRLRRRGGRRGHHRRGNRERRWWHRGPVHDRRRRNGQSQRLRPRDRGHRGVLRRKELDPDPAQQGEHRRQGEGPDELSTGPLGRLFRLGRGVGGAAGVGLPYNPVHVVARRQGTGRLQLGRHHRWFVRRERGHPERLRLLVGHGVG